MTCWVHPTLLQRGLNRGGRLQSGRRRAGSCLRAGLQNSGVRWSEEGPPGSAGTAAIWQQSRAGRCAALEAEAAAVQPSCQGVAAAAAQPSGGCKSSKAVGSLLVGAPRCSTREEKKSLACNGVMGKLTFSKGRRHGLCEAKSSLKLNPNCLSWSIARW